MTCGIYGWMVHTRFFKTEKQANSDYDKMKVSMAAIIGAFRGPGYDDRDATVEASETYVAEYP